MFITRFAPSPTGYLHFGNARTALLSWLLAQQHNGTMQLRLEDTDRNRSSEEYAAAVIEDLHWLGLTFSTAPDGKPWRQSQRNSEYEAQFARLRQHLYPCFCSEEELAAERRAQRAAGKPPRYSGKCAQRAPADAEKLLNSGAAAAWRFRVPPDEQLEVDDFVRGKTRFATDTIGDFVVRRANGDFSFLFANAVDDALLGVTDVLRGEDHVANTPRQLLLLKALGFAAPRYGHLALIVGADSKPLSKRHGLTPLRDWRAQGYLPQAAANYLARVGHSYPPACTAELMSMDELAQNFSSAALGRAPAQLDTAQLHQWQKSAVLTLSAAAYNDFLGSTRRQRMRQLPATVDAEAFFALTHENVVLPEDCDSWIHIIGGDTLNHISDDAAAVIRTAAADETFYPAAAAAAEHDDWKTFCATVGKQCNKKGKALFLPLRAALTGRLDGPAMPNVYALLSPALRRQRFQQAANSRTS